MNICFDTFGCRLNRAEALEEEAQARLKGHKIVDSHQEADLIVIRACSVTGKAQHDCETEIARLKEKYPNKRIWVTGCIKNAKPLVIREAGKVATGLVHVPTRTARAYLKVQDGCNSACTYCIVPKFRGASRPVPFEDVMAKARAFIASGYREIVVTGCNLCQYPRFPDLVAALCDLDGECRIRLGSVEPGPFARELVDLMAEKPNLCRFLHLSIQSGSQRVLTAMHRPYTAKDLDKLLEYADQTLPGACLGCDIISGFPGESELDHHQTMGLFARHNLVNAHVFPYSERPGTIAAMLPGQLPREVRRSRAREIAQIASANFVRFKRRFVRKEVEVVVENVRDDRNCSGWTGEYVWCECQGRGLSGARKSKVKVLVAGTSDRGLVGKVV